MKLKNTTILLFSALALSGCSKKNKTLKTKINEIGQGGVSGAVMFENTNGRMSATITLAGKPNTTNAVHIHEYGDCSGTDGKKAGGHWNPTEEDHGTWGSNEYHSGDLGNIKTDRAGNGEETIVDMEKRWTIGGSEETNIIGKAIIVHEKADDGTSQPSGNAGKRVGCGEISDK